VVADVVVVADGAPVAASGVQAAAGAAGLLGGPGGRQRGPGQGEQAPDGGTEGGVAQGAGEAGGVLVALPDQPGEQVQGGVEVALDVEVAGHPGAGETEFARLEQQVAQGPAVAHHEGGRGRGAGLGAVPGTDADGKRCAQQLFDVDLQPRRGVS